MLLSLRVTIISNIYSVCCHAIFLSFEIRRFLVVDSATLWIILRITHIAWTTLRVAHTLHNTTATTLLQERTSSNLHSLSCDTIADLLRIALRLKLRE